MFQIQKAPTTKKAGGHSKSSGTERKSNYGSGTGTAFADMSIHYHSDHQTPVVQMIRKRVKGAAGTFTEEDIYYDKSDGKYYKGMTQAGHGDVTIQAGEYEEYKKLVNKDQNIPNIQNPKNKDRTEKTTILAKTEQGEGKIYAGNIKPVEGHAGEGNAAGTDIAATADIFTVGQEITPLKVVRLYAEGNMKHAASLARAFENPDKYRLFEGLGANSAINNADNTTPEVLVKATEYDNLSNLAGRYSGETEGSILNRCTGPERLEASFGGFTGDMTREHQNKDQNHVPQPPQRRLYDIIQATFFWLPGKTNQENLDQFKNFMSYKMEKLKPGGKIRIILTNKNSREYYYTIRSNNDQIRSNSDEKISKLENCYGWVADQLCRDNEWNKNFTITRTFFHASNAQRQNVGQTYADKLTALGMNEAGFVHTRTQGLIEVRSSGDVMIEAKKKPIVNT